MFGRLPHWCNGRLVEQTKLNVHTHQCLEGFHTGVTLIWLRKAKLNVHTYECLEGFHTGVANGCLVELGGRWFHTGSSPICQNHFTKNSNKKLPNFPPKNATFPSTSHSDFQKFPTWRIYFGIFSLKFSPILHCLSTHNISHWIFYIPQSLFLE